MHAHQIYESAMFSNNAAHIRPGPRHTEEKMACNVPVFFNQIFVQIFSVYSRQTLCFALSVYFLQLEMYQNTLLPRLGEFGFDIGGTV